MNNMFLIVWNKKEHILFIFCNRGSTRIIRGFLEDSTTPTIEWLGTESSIYT